MKKYLLLIFFAWANILFAQNKIKVIKAGKIIDVLHNTVLTNQVIVITGNRITDVGGNFFYVLATSAHNPFQFIVLCRARGLPGREIKKNP